MLPRSSRFRGELNATAAYGDMDRAVDSVSIDVLASNLFPFGEVGARLPFSLIGGAGSSDAIFVASAGPLLASGNVTVVPSTRA